MIRARIYALWYRASISTSGSSDLMVMRSLTLREERRLSEAFALLAANSDDPGRVAAACVEEHRLKQLLTVKLSVNKGELNAVKKSLDKIALILQRISRQC
jgi:hypothetical protein